MNPKVPSAPFSVSGAGSRLNAGTGGIYQKQDSKVLWDGNGLASGQQRILRATVTCPSSRIKVAFGVSGKTTDLNNIASYVFKYGEVLWNAIPYTKQPGSYSSPTAPSSQAPDTRDLIAGRPIFWMVPPGFTGTPTAAVPNVAPPYIEGQSTFASGGIYDPGTIGQCVTPETLLNAEQIGRCIPDAYEAISAVKQYDIYVWLDNTSGAPYNNMIPIQVWASWEIIDPRDKEDSEALLAGCTLESLPTIHS